MQHVFITPTGSGQPQLGTAGRHEYSSKVPVTPSSVEAHVSVVLFWDGETEIRIYHTSVFKTAIGDRDKSTGLQKPRILSSLIILTFTLKLRRSGRVLRPDF